MERLLTDFTLPELGEQIEAGDVLRVLVKVGDTIAKEQPVVELETDKATIEVPSSVAGRVAEIKVKAGDKVQVGAVVLTVEDSSAPAPAAKQDEKAPEKVVAMPKRETAAPPAAAQEQPRAAAVSPKPAEPAKADVQQPQAAQAKPSGGPAAPASPSVRRLAREIG